MLLPEMPEDMQRSGPAYEALRRKLQPKEGGEGADAALQEQLQQRVAQLQKQNDNLREMVSVQKQQLSAAKAAADAQRAAAEAAATAEAEAAVEAAAAKERSRAAAAAAEEESAALKFATAGDNLTLYLSSGKKKHDRFFWLTPKTCTLAWDKKKTTNGKPKKMERVVSVEEGLPELRSAKEWFDEFDSDGSGALTDDELSALYKKAR